MNDQDHKGIPRTTPRQSATFSQDVNSDIRRAAATGIYDIRGGGAKRRVPNFDDLLFMGASISRYPLEGYREKCDTKVTLGTRFAKNPIELDIPITIAGMSFVRPCQGSIGARCQCGWDINDHRRRWHDPRRTRAFHQAGLSVPAVTLWYEP